MSHQSILQMTLLEARRNPEMNPKTSINQSIADYVESSSEPAYVSFTALDKLGINPKSIHKTPVGIYAFPAEYVIEKTKGGKSMINLPYAGDVGFANLFHVQGNWLWIDKMSEADAEQHYQQLAQIWSKLARWKIERSTDQIQKLINEAPNKALVKDLPGGRFWYVTMRVAELMVKKFKGTMIVQWNKLFRLLGYDGLHDTGAGIIHKNEPTQSLFFTIDVVKDVKRAVNRYSPEDWKAGTKEGGRRIGVAGIVRRTAARLSDQQLIDEFVAGTDNFQPEDLNFIADRTRVRIGVLKERPRMIQYIDNPTVPEQFVVLRSNPILALDLAERKVLDNLALEFVIEKGTPHQIQALLSGMTRVIAEHKFKPSIPVMKAMVDYDIHVLRVLAVQKLMLIPRSVIQYAIAQLSPNIPDWLETYARNYKLIQ